MDALGHHVRIHLTGSAGGIELFSRGSDLHDPEARQGVRRIHGELKEERRQLLAAAARLGVRPAPLTAFAARLGERVGRLKPNGDLLHRTPLTDLIDLEAMRIAVSGKLAGWEALLAVVDQHDGLRRHELETLRDQAVRQLDDLVTFHRAAAARALTH